VEFSVAHPGLQQLAETAVHRIVSAPEFEASLDDIEALMILANWSPAIGGLSQQLPPPATITGVAVRMARVLELDKAPERVMILRKRATEHGGMTATEKLVYDQRMFESRLVGMCYQLGMVITLIWFLYYNSG
jgi:hypothetical protein